MISLIDILQKYLCVIHGSSTVYQDDDGVMLCDGLVHETTRFTSQLPQYISKNFPALECNLQRVFSHTFFNFPLIISPKHFAVRFLQAKDTFYFVKNVFFSPVMYSHLDPQTHISRQHFSVVSAPEREAKKHPPFFFPYQINKFFVFFHQSIEIFLTTFNTNGK